MRPDILALIPAHNEATRITPVIQGAMQHLPVLVVDDGSTDATSAIAEEAGAQVLRQVPNQGKGQALKTGFQAALEQGYEALIMLDADGQHDPAEIPDFLARWEADRPDLIIGTRNFRYMPPVRRTTNTIGRWMFSRALGQKVQDNQSGYRLLSRRMVAASLESKEGSFEFEVDMIVQCLKRGWKLAEIPIRTIYGDQTSHISPLRHVREYFRMMAETRKAMRR